MVEPRENETAKAAIIPPILWPIGPRSGLRGNLALPAIGLLFMATSFQAVQ